MTLPALDPRVTPAFPADYAALVTGGAQGIGLAIARALLDAGLAVVIVDSDTAAGAEAEADLRDSGGAHFIAGDAADEGVIQRAVAKADALGRGLYAAVGNTGISVAKPVTELTLDEWNRVLAVNLTSHFLLAKYAAAALNRRHGAMVLTASTRAYQSEPGWEAYGASKGGVVALTHALAMSLGPVRVNCVCPGWIETGHWQRSDRRSAPEHSDADRAQHAVGRVGTPEDIALMVRHLLSPAAGFITGQSFVVDGGMTRKMIYV